MAVMEDAEHDLPPKKKPPTEDEKRRKKIVAGTLMKALMRYGGGEATPSYGDQRHGGRLEHNETYCGSCYGAEASDEDCCNSCEEVREAYRKKGWAITNADLVDQCKREGFLQRIKDEEGEGCNVYGFLEVNKVVGNFHFAPGKSFQQSNIHVHDLLTFQMDNFNISHKINRLAFRDYFPGVVNPLDNVRWTQKTPNGMYQYFIKVVPTVYMDLYGHTIQSNQVTRIMGAEADSPYDIVRVNSKMSPDNIKKRYWKLSLWVHPDKCRQETNYLQHKGR